MCRKVFLHKYSNPPSKSIGPLRYASLASHCDFMLAGCLQNFVSLSYRCFYAKQKETKKKISCSSVVIILADDVVQINATIICLPEYGIYGVHIKQFK